MDEGRCGDFPFTDRYEEASRNISAMATVLARKSTANTGRIAVHDPN
jgi:hypothetical protein